METFIKVFHDQQALLQFINRNIYANVELNSITKYINRQIPIFVLSYSASYELF